MVSSVCSIQNPFSMSTGCDGLSSLLHSLSPGEQPIVNVPGAIHTYFCPSIGLSQIFGCGLASRSAELSRGAFGSVVRDFDHSRYTIALASKANNTNATAIIVRRLCA